MAYSRTTWRAGDAITQDRLNKIEQGIVDVTDASASTAGTVSTLADTVAEHTRSIARASTVADQAMSTASDAATNALSGSKAWTQISAAITESFETHPTYDTLKALIDAIYAKINSNQATNTSNYTTLNGSFTRLETEVHEARSTLKNGTTATTLLQKITDMDQLIDSNRDGIDVLSETIKNARGTYNSIDARFDAAESAIQDNADDISDIQTEINNAHTQSLTTLVARFQADETAINSKIPLANIVDDLEESGNSDDTVLHAHQGYVLRNIIGGDYTTLNTVASDIGSKVSKDDIKKNLTYDTDDNTVLQARQGKLLKDEIDSINDAIGGNYGENNTIADAIADAIDTAAADATSKANTAESNATTYANQLIYNGLDQTTTGKALDATQGKVLNDAITDSTTGLAAIKAIADRADTAAATANANLGEGFNSTTTVASAISAINSTLANKASTSDVNNISTTIVKAKEDVSYTENTPSTTQTWTINDKDDYLLQAEDNKYYYWKHINNEWHLMGGAGNSESGSSEETGNTSGFIYTAQQYADLKANHPEELVENTDYYVLQSDVQYEGDNSRSIQAYHHYRYIKNNQDVLQEIEIGEPISRAKTYTIEREDDVSTGTSYLNLYEFDYGMDNGVINTDDSRMYLRAHIDLPKGGGESSASSLKLIRLNDETRQIRVGKKVYLYAYFSAIEDEQTENGKYTLKYNGITIDANDLISGKATDDPNNWIVIEDPKFTEGINPTPIITSPDDTKLYIIQQHTNEGDVYTQWKYVAGTWTSTPGYPSGFIALDVTNRCKTGDNSFTLTATAVNRSRSRTWNVNIVDLRLESNAPDTLLINVNTPYSFSYIPYGAIPKSLKITIDDNEPIIRSIGTSSGLESYYELEGLSHGAHIIHMQLTGNINGRSEDSDEIIRQYIWYDPEDSSSDVILASRYNNQTETIEQYSNIEIPYQVYKKDADEILVYYYLDNSETPFSSVKLTETNNGILSYVAADEGNHKLTIKVDNQTLEVNLIVTPATKSIAPISGAIIDFDPAPYSNDAVERLPQWKVGQNTYKFTDSSNFNWSSNANGGGYKEDEDGKCLVIKAGSYIDLNYNLFRTESEATRANVFKRGAEMKIIFKTKAVRNAEAVWFTNTGDYQNKTVGLQLGAHYGWLKTDKAVDTKISADEDSNPDTITIKGITYNYWKPNTSYTVNTIVVIRKVIYKCINAENTAFAIDLQDSSIDLDDSQPKSYLKKWLKLGQLDTEIISTDSYLYFPYSEEDKIELDININPSDSDNQFIMSYEDGVPSKAYAYTTSDHLQHSNNTIRIGSNDCDVYIYRLRIYDRSLTTANILQNFIADGKTVEEKIKRHDRNCIYWNNTENKYYIQKTGEAKLDPIKLAELMPDVKILMLDTPRFTTGKKDFIRDTTLRCIHAPGGKVYASRGDADNWFFDNGFHAGQGTTSDNYGQSARNVDFLFEVDGTHWPTKSKDMTGFKNPPDYKSRVWIGENASKYIVTENDPAGHWMPTSKYDKENEEWIIDDEIVNPEEGIEVTEPSVCDDWMGDDCKISLTSTSIPNNYFNLKENVASSENVNNALFQKRYNDFLPYNSPAKKRDERIKNCMEFVPAVLFVRESGPLADHTEFNDTEWHFYGLGNLGDSKKSDYTRAYDPEDMYEFTCENSDNNTNNGQFQSGVFMYNNIRAIETNYSEWNATTMYNENAIVTREGSIYQYTGEDMVQGHEWNASEWNDITPAGNEIHYYAPRTNPDTMSYIYPITSEEWNITLNNNYVNRKHYTLVTEEFDGDHSFEFRYACRGDYRDGDLINVSEGQDDNAQFDLNHDVVLALYEWLVTSTEEQYKNEASQWMVKPAMEFFYAFTHYYTMMDNRAKNTFWHFAKTGEYRKVTRPVKELLHVYEESNDAVKNNETGVYTGTFTKTALTTLPETYYVQGYIPVTDKHFKEGITYYKLNIGTNTYSQTSSVNYTDKNGAPLTMTIKPDYEIPETAEALYTLGFIQTEESTFLPNVQYYTYTNNAYVPATVTVGDPIKYLYTQYAFDLWVYDCDTAAGIDNNGAQVFPYGKEDDDYRVKGEPSSGWAFNGAGSIFWRRLKTTFIDEIANIMNTVDDNCFNSENLINEFDTFQNCFPEEIWRLDIERKYIRTFTGVTNQLPYDNAVSEGKQNARFLMSMMQGRKKYQRRQWIRNQGVYFNSKYLLKDIKNNSNTTEFNIITPTGDINDLAVRPSYNLELTPYQDMYLNVTIGNGGPTPSIRAEAGKTYTIDLLPYSAGTFAETRLYIYGFKSIAGLGNLAPMYPYSFTLNGLEHLKQLDIGTENSGYRNFNLSALPFTSNTKLPLLEKLNIRNCNNLAGGIDLSTANNLLEVKADGTLISSIDLPRYTHIEKLYLPSTVQNLDLYSAHFLKDLKIYNGANESYTNLYTLNIYDSDYSSTYIWIAENRYKVGDIVIIDNNVYECKTAHTSVAAEVQNNNEEWNTYIANNWTLIKANSSLPVDWISIAKAMLQKQDPVQSSISLLKLYSATINDINELESLVEIKDDLEQAGNELELSGTINVTGSWSSVEKTNYESIWPINLNVNEENEEEKCKLVYKYPDEIVNGEIIPGEILHSVYVNKGARIEEIYPSIISEKPKKDPTVSTVYTFGAYRETGAYISLSGWTLSTEHKALNTYSTIPTVTVDTIVYPYFQESERKYKVRWFLNRDNTDEISTNYNDQIYGGGYDLVAPTVADIHAAGFETATISVDNNANPVTATYRIFNGWDKLPANITPTVHDTSYNIYAQWIEGTNEPVSQIFETIGADGLTPKQLLVLSGMTNKNSNDIIREKGISMGMQSSYYLGYDGLKTGTTLIEKDTPVHYYHNDSDSFVTNIQPLANNKAFTLVIDYYFDPNTAYNDTSAVAAVLAGCYENSSGSIRGFGLFKGLSNNLSGIRVGFGEMFKNSGPSIQVGVAGQRNIVVLRHPANSANLYVYSGTTSDGLITTSATLSPLTRNINTTGATDAYLNFGQLSDNPDEATSSLITDAEGIIYWAKYWDEDLGAGECQQIANWPHEKMTFALSNMRNSSSGGLRSGNRTINNETITPSLELLTLSSSQHAQVKYSPFIQTTASWGRDTTLRNLFNSTIYKSLPLELQSILYKGNIYSQPVEYSNVNSVSNYELQDSPDITQDYIYSLSIANVNSDSSGAYAREVSRMLVENTSSALAPWIDSNNVTVYNYDISNSNFWVEAPRNKDYLNLRFPGVPMKITNARIFMHSTQIPTNNGSTYYDAISKIPGGILPGDIFIIGSLAYIYVTSESIIKGIPIKSGTEFACVSNNQPVGGWVESVPYTLRSMYSSGEGYYRTNYIYINTGAVISNNTTGNGYTANLNYALQI